MALYTTLTCVTYFNLRSALVKALCCIPFAPLTPPSRFSAPSPPPWVFCAWHSGCVPHTRGGGGGAWGWSGEVGLCDGQKAASGGRLEAAAVGQFVGKVSEGIAGRACVVGVPSSVSLLFRFCSVCFCVVLKTLSFSVYFCFPRAIYRNVFLRSSEVGRKRETIRILRIIIVCRFFVCV